MNSDVQVFIIRKVREIGEYVKRISRESFKKFLIVGEGDGSRTPFKLVLTRICFLFRNGKLQERGIKWIVFADLRVESANLNGFRKKNLTSKKPRATLLLGWRVVREVLSIVSLRPQN